MAITTQSTAPIANAYNRNLSIGTGHTPIAQAAVQCPAEVILFIVVIGVCILYSPKDFRSTAFQSGIYDVTNRKAINQVTIPIDQVAGSSYQRIDLGVHQLNGGMYIWFAPTQNPAVSKVSVDRIILIREK